MKLETLSVHAGYSPDPTTFSCWWCSIYQTTSMHLMIRNMVLIPFDLKVPGNIYTRIMNPTNDVLETTRCRLRRRDCGSCCGIGYGRDYLCYPPLHKWAITLCRLRNSMVVHNLMAIYFSPVSVSKRVLPP